MHFPLFPLLFLRSRRNRQPQTQNLPADLLKKNRVLLEQNQALVERIRQLEADNEKLERENQDITTEHFEEVIHLEQENFRLERTCEGAERLNLELEEYVKSLERRLEIFEEGTVDSASDCGGSSCGSSEDRHNSFEGCASTNECQPAMEDECTICYAIKAGQSDAECQAEARHAVLQNLAEKIRKYQKEKHGGTLLLEPTAETHYSAPNDARKERRASRSRRDEPSEGRERDDLLGENGGSTGD
ncbi:hypothetical protein BJ508DRAFT_311029 [Ascobolus immersus RN42]|uniref:Uncharacterized protein n=1 Tax=Ascobolus immersus RN42 TaxID=1160509 RepID=A0A3N4HX26_ASCIM|nr:hypothetical protein BJ508DRAFT_311029 [Ascobolus immersus RN42]